MPKTIKKWLQEDVDKLDKVGIDKLSTLYFHRDPSIPIIQDRNFFFAPASGIILYQKFVEKSDDPIVEIKGKNFTLKDLLQDDEYPYGALVIGIFMSQYDIHVQRMSYSGFMTYEDLDTLVTCNAPMLALENNVLDGIVDNDNLEYLYLNERRLSTVYVPAFQWKYHMLLIADEDIDVIMHYIDKEGDYLYQNERCSVIKYGSQVDLILPASKNGELPFDYKLLVKDHMHVEAGVDKLIQIFPKGSLIKK